MFNARVFDVRWLARAYKPRTQARVYLCIDYEILYILEIKKAQLFKENMNQLLLIFFNEC
jgi:hypothetical protein